LIEEYGIKTLDDVDVRGRTVIVRVDINSPVDPSSKRILDASRIKEHSQSTIRELIDKEAKVVVLAHQGRKGERDFISLRPHAEVMSEVLPVEVKFVDDIFGDKAKATIASLKPGEVLLLENVRMWDGETSKRSPEEHSKSELVENLAPLADFFVFDAFAVSHRPHASVVGFIPKVPTVIGRVMERELRALIKVRERPERPCVYVLGGAKAEDSAEVAEGVLGKGIADRVLTGGLVANLFLYSKGVDLGKVNVKILEDKGFLVLRDRVKDLLDKHGEKVLLPSDLAVEGLDGKRVEVKVSNLPVELLIKDIGEDTIREYRKEILRAKTIVVNGPMGVFEDERFSKGTVELFKAIAESKAFSVIGGGHTIAAATKFGFRDKVSFVSTGGGALMEYLSKGTLPVLEALKKYAKA